MRERGGGGVGKWNNLFCHTGILGVLLAVIFCELRWIAEGKGGGGEGK